LAKEGLQRHNKNQPDSVEMQILSQKSQKLVTRETGQKWTIFSDQGTWRLIRTAFRLTATEIVLFIAGEAKGARSGGHPDDVVVASG